MTIIYIFLIIQEEWNLESQFYHTIITHYLVHLNSLSSSFHIIMLLRHYFEVEKHLFNAYFGLKKRKIFHQDLIHTFLGDCLYTKMRPDKGEAPIEPFLVEGGVMGTVFWFWVKFVGSFGVSGALLTEAPPFDGNLYMKRTQNLLGMAEKKKWTMSPHQGTSILRSSWLESIYKVQILAMMRHLLHNESYNRFYKNQLIPRPCTEKFSTR